MGEKKKRIKKIGRLYRTFENKERIILRDFLALERTTLANERTLFAYARSSLYLSLGAVAILQIEEISHLKWIAFVLFGISGFLVIYGTIRYVALRRKLTDFYDRMEEERLEARKGKESELK